MIASLTGFLNVFAALLHAQSPPCPPLVLQGQAAYIEQTHNAGEQAQHYRAGFVAMVLPADLSEALAEQQIPPGHLCYHHNQLPASPMLPCVEHVPAAVFVQLNVLTTSAVSVCLQRQHTQE